MVSEKSIPYAVALACIFSDLSMSYQAINVHTPFTKVAIPPLATERGTQQVLEP